MSRRKSLLKKRRRRSIIGFEMIRLLAAGIPRRAGAVDRFVSQNPQHNGPTLVGNRSGNAGTFH